VSKVHAGGPSKSKLRRGPLTATLEEVMSLMGARAVLFHQAVADRLGLHVTDLRCLVLVRGFEGSTEPIAAGQLAEFTGLTTGAITGVIDRLERAGFVRRDKDERDRRRVIVHPLRDRDRELARLFSPLERAMSELLARYREEDLVLLVDFATRASPLFRAETARLRARSPAASPAPPRRGRLRAAPRT
jgi:DNA-binding MarR family transcriptional regulator